MFCGTVVADPGGFDSEKTQGRREPRLSGVIRGVCGAVCVTQHSGVVTAVDSGDWAVVVRRDAEACRETLRDILRPRERNSMARTGLDNVPSTNEGGRAEIARPPMANRGHRIDLLDRGARRQSGREAADG